MHLPKQVELRTRYFSQEIPFKTQNPFSELYDNVIGTVILNTEYLLPVSLSVTDTVTDIVCLLTVSWQSAVRGPFRALLLLRFPRFPLRKSSFVACL
jgi:hypothetical protein